VSAEFDAGVDAGLASRAGVGLISRSPGLQLAPVGLRSLIG
jgi:hypothetical protein